MTKIEKANNLDSVPEIKVKPLITEKSFDKANKGWYSFLVEKKVNKNQARKAIEKTFSVNVTEIRSVVKKGKNKRSWKTRRLSRQNDSKKIMVKLAKDQKIEIFETGGQASKQ